MKIILSILIELASRLSPLQVYDAVMAKHYETGEPLPRELFDKLCEQKTFQAGMGMSRQLYLGALDMALHHSYDPANEQISIFDVQKEIASK